MGRAIPFAHCHLRFSEVEDMDRRAILIGCVGAGDGVGAGSGEGRYK